MKHRTAQKSFFFYFAQLFAQTSVRKILVSVKFLSAILGPEMGASILWTPGKMIFFFLQEEPMSIKFLVLGGGVFGVLGRGGGADFIFMGARIFLIFYFAQLFAQTSARLIQMCHHSFALGNAKA